MNACSRRTAARQGPGALGLEAPHRMMGSAVGPQILGGRQALLDPAVQAGHGAHLLLRLGHGSMPASAHHPHGGDDVEQTTRSQAPVQHGEHGQGPDGEERGAHGLGHDLAEEVADRGHVAVDALDQLARRVRAVELVVQAQHVAGEHDSDRVRRPPGRGGRRPHGGHLQDLRRDRQGEEHPGQAGQRGRVRPTLGAVDDPPHHERPGQAERRRRRDERAKPDPPATVGSEQRAQGAPT
ncbi:MAG: hypothetical protein V9E89_06120 [Ilumatobacteraceae bacterium]